MGFLMKLKFKVGTLLVIVGGISVLIINTLCFSVFSEVIRSIINGFFLMLVTVLGLIALSSWCRQPPPEKPLVRIVVWASVTFDEARDWYTRHADKKPQVNFQQHTMKVWPDGSSEALGTNDASEYASTTDAKIAVPSEVTICEGTCEYDLERGVRSSDVAPPAAVQGEAETIEVQGEAETFARSTVVSEAQDGRSDMSLCCACCLGDFEQPTTIALLRCGHMFCEECIRTWASKSPSCPTCRASMLTQS